MHGVLEQGVECDPQRLWIDAQAPCRQRAESPRARSDLRPAHEDVFEIGLEIDLAENDEVGMVRFREEEELLEDPLDSSELVECHVDLVERPVPVLTQDLEMPPGDCRGSTQLV